MSTNTAELARSFAGLVANNNGMFKSQSQANFLLGQCSNLTYTVSGHFIKGGYVFQYTCDSQGITKVVKYTKSKGFVLQWERVTTGKVPVQNLKEINRLKKIIVSIESTIQKRILANSQGVYIELGMPGLFESSQQSDLEQLREAKARLNALMSV